MSPDTLATVAMAAAVLLAVVGICHTEPGGLYRALGGEHTGRHVRPADTPRERHLPPLHSHAAPRGFTMPDTPALPAPAAEDVTKVTSPWVVPDVPATIPDALTNVRTA